MSMLGFLSEYHVAWYDKIVAWEALWDEVDEHGCPGIGEPAKIEQRAHMVKRWWAE